MSHIKKNSWRFRLIMAAFAGAIVVSIVSIFYITSSPIFLPVNIAVSGASQEELKNIHFFGEKPFGGDYEIPRPCCRWKGEEAFYKAIRVELPETLNTGNIVIRIEAGGDVSNYNIGELKPVPSNKSGFNGFHLNPVIKSPGSFSDKLLMFVSKPMIPYAALAFILFILILLLWNKLSRIPTVYKKVKEHLLLFIESTIKSKQRLILFCSISGICLSIGFGVGVHFSDAAGTANLPDSYDYQAIAVNYAVGNEFPVSGITHPVETYKYDTLSPETLAKLHQTSGFLSLHRAPVFSLFCGLIYKAVGIHPVVIKYILLILLCFTCVFIIYAASTIFGTKGFVAGNISGIALIILNYHDADILSPGSIFISLWVVLAFYLFFRYLKEPGFIRVILLAVLFASSWLTTYSLMLVPGFFILSLFILALRRKSSKLFLHLIVHVLVLIAVLLPWQIKVNSELKQLKPGLEQIKTLALDTLQSQESKQQKANQIFPLFGSRLIPDSSFNGKEISVLQRSILPSTRQNGYYPNPGISEDMNQMAFLEDIRCSPDYVFLFLPKPNHEALSCHNEFVAKGMIAQDWRLKNCFYTRQDTTNTNDVSRIAGFYRENPDMLFLLSNDKLTAAFGSYNELLALFCLSLGILFLMLLQQKKLKTNKLFVKILALGLPFALLASLHYISWLYIVILIIFSLSLIIKPWLTTSSTFDRITGFFFLNYIVIVVIAYGIDRYVQPLQFLMLFLAVYVHLIFIGKFRELFRKKE